MIKEIVKSGNSVLRTKSRKIEKLDKKALSLIKDLKETIEAQVDPEGVGLAAPQIGVNQRVFVTKPERNGPIKVVINPEILFISKETEPKSSSLKERTSYRRKKIMEGCLSLPNYYTPLERKYKIKIKYKNELWKDVEEEYVGIDAQIIQHEIDHLDGILFIDRMLEQKRKLYEYDKGEWEEVEL